MMLQLYRGINARDFKGWEERLLDLMAQVPTTVLWGDKSPFITPERAERFGKAQVEHFADYSHWLPVEAPDLVAQRLDAFLQGQQGQSQQ
ncbi:alpha/beta fold hydrolase [Dictyobacter arantiisoli]|uniref:AB hydrolase-1 domain-containing protein n=1 Tax=Dictyobacter arantiisoli TaxID=2014874 RepID=A0A5A5TG74_9CHLR|nr:alpha/beta hydrolase [Dictyobacter arantiisoli]GCF10009.1 hypothetical protein KDI_35730 [Dictyobacter arantiisoli]